MSKTDRFTQNIDMYFSYHACAKRLIETGHCLGYEYLPSYHGISPCLLIYFDNHIPMPIRSHRFDEYLFLFAKFGIMELKTE